MRGIAAHGQGEQLRYALERTGAFVSALEDYFGIPYPYRKLDLVAVPDFSAGAIAKSPPIEEEPPEYGVFFVANGVEETYAYCTACHSERLVAQQGLDRYDWIELLEWMVEEQSMAEIEEPDLSIVLDYLTTNYNIDRPNFPKN